MKWKGFGGTSKIEGDSDEDFRPVAYDEKKDSMNGSYSKAPKKQFIVQVAILAWLLALTVVLWIFIKENAKTEERIAKVETKATVGKVSGKILMPEGDVITEIDKRLKKLETVPAGAASPASAPDSKVVAELGDRLKQVEEKLAKPASATVLSKDEKSETFKQLRERVDRLEGLISKSTLGTKENLQPTSQKPTEEAKGPQKAVEAKETPKTVEEAKETPKMTQKVKIAKADRLASPKKLTASKTKRGVKAKTFKASGKDIAKSYRETKVQGDRGFLTDQYAGYHPVRSGADTIYAIGEHYDSKYNQAADDLRSFNFHPMDEAFNAAQIMRIPTAKGQ